MVKVLLTGSEGYLGGEVKRLLVQGQHAVTGVDAGWFSHPQVQGGRKLVSSLDVDEVAGHDVVVHLAWFSSAGDVLSKLQRFSLEETEHLVDLCKEASTRLIFASTTSVYGYYPGGALLSEDNEPHPVCAYGKTKLAAERYIADQLEPGEYIIFRKGTLMGRSSCPSGRTRLDLVVNAFVASAMSREKVIKVWAPETRRPLLHVADAAAAYVWAVEQPFPYNILNLAHKNYTILPLAYWVRHCMTGLPSSVDLEVKWQVDDGSTRSYEIDSGRAASLGLVMDKGVKLAVHDLLGQPQFDFDNPTCRNIPWMEHLLQMRGWLDSVDFPTVAFYGND